MRCLTQDRCRSCRVRWPRRRGPDLAGVTERRGPWIAETTPFNHGDNAVRGRSRPRVRETPPLTSCQNQTLSPTLNSGGERPDLFRSTALTRRARFASAAACVRMAAAPSARAISTSRASWTAGSSNALTAAASVEAVDGAMPPKKSSYGDVPVSLQRALYWNTACRNSARQAVKSSVRRSAARTITQTRSTWPAAWA